MTLAPHEEAPPAVSLLFDWLADRECVPDATLTALFTTAGRISPTVQPELITSPRMLVAIVDLGADPEWANEPSLRNVSELLRRIPQAYARFRAEVTAGTHTAAEAEARVTDLTANIERAIDEACREAQKNAVGAPAVVTVSDFLFFFPPSGSVADKVLSNLGATRDEVRQATEAGSRAGRAGGTDLKGDREAAANNTAQKGGAALNDRVSTHADEPATLDELGRAAFADILADRIREARNSGQTAEPTAFIVHLHGPWGSGKSSVLNFLEDNLAKGHAPWIVVKFNAWRDQRLQPPWWRLITTIYYGARAKLGWRAPWLWLRWLVWRVRADYMPLLSVLAVAAIATFLLWRLDWPAKVNGGRPPDWMDMAKWLLPLVITLLTAIYVNSRSLALGSRRAAQTYADLKDDPFKPIARLFNQLVDSIDRPLVVFIDDLDRCDSKYVVELLEGIQTLMRGAAVTYVVAADRKWICSSFEQRYAGFSPPIGESGRPLGYLFLDKLFQVSAAIPQIPPDIQSFYWARLLSPTATDPSREAEARAEAAKQAEQEAGALSRQEDLQALVQQASKTGDRIRIQAVRAACAKRISSPDAVVRTEHRLQAFAHLLEPNPRAMKRLVNAYAMHQATLLLAGRETGVGALARWTILELRWPLLADFLAIRCECVDALHRRLAAEELPQIPESLRCLFGDELVKGVIGAEEDEDRLTTDEVKTILGAVQGDR